MLKQIAYIDFKNFVANDKTDSGKKKFLPFEGNIEEQTVVLHKQFPLREIPTKVEYTDEEEDADDMFASDKEDKQNDDTDKHPLEAEGIKIEENKEDTVMKANEEDDFKEPEEVPVEAK